MTPEMSLPDGVTCMALYDLLMSSTRFDFVAVGEVEGTPASLVLQDIQTDEYVRVSWQHENTAKYEDDEP